MSDIDDLKAELKKVREAGDRTRKMLDDLIASGLGFQHTTGKNIIGHNTRIVGQLEITQPAGIPPMVVASNNTVVNLDSDTVDGAHAADFELADPALQAHLIDTNNPHATTLAQLGTGSWVSWTPSYTGFATDPINPNSYYALIDSICLFTYHPTSGISNDTMFTISLPFAAKTIAGMNWSGLCRVRDNGIWRADPGLWQIVSGGSVINVYPTTLGGSFTNVNQKSAIIQGMYEVT